MLGFARGMPLDAVQERFLGRFFPELVARIEALGPGEFSKHLCHRQAKGAGIRGIRFNLEYIFDDSSELRIRIALELRRGIQPYVPGADRVRLKDWSPSSYSMHYGPPGGTHFRNDLDAVRGHHVHIPPDEHVPAADVRPDVIDIDPREFVELVAQFRTTGQRPINRTST